MKFYQTAQVRAKPEKAKPAPTTKLSAASSTTSIMTTTTATKRRTTSRPLSTVGKSRLEPMTRPAVSTASSSVATTPIRPTSQIISKKRLANSPLKQSPSTVREISRDKDLGGEEIRPSMGGARQMVGSRAGGLTGRSLASARPVSMMVPETSSNNSVNVNSLNNLANVRLMNAEKELEQLKLEKSEWTKERESYHWHSQEEQAEKAQLMQEINDLQLKNAQLVEEHTRDILAIKSKETQLIRSMSDVDTAKVRITKLENEIERLQVKLREQLTLSENVSINTAKNEGINNNNNNNNNNMSNSGLRLFNTGRRASATLQANNNNNNNSSPKSPTMTLQFGLEPRNNGTQHRSKASSGSISRSIDFSINPTVFGQAGDRSSFHSSSSSSAFKSVGSPLVEGKQEQMESDARTVSTSSQPDEEGDIPMTEESESEPVPAVAAAAIPAPAQQQQQQQQQSAPLRRQSTTGSSVSHIPAPSSSYIHSQSASGQALPGENWKRAVEVTTQLRARIEAMKARQKAARG